MATMKITEAHPEYVHQWSKRNDKAPDQVARRSAKKFWWVCDKGHEWETSPAYRFRSKTDVRGCAVCANKVIVPGVNDLGTTHPELSQQWSQRNERTVQETTYGSSQKAWWVCSKGHEWEAVINNRVNGRGCPTCSGRRVVPGLNDLATLRPELVEMWSPDNELLPSQVQVQSNKKVEWVCPEGHKWKTAIHLVTSSKTGGCPVCSGHKVVQGVNDLFTLRPDLEDEWHPDNEDNPEQVGKGSDVYALWRCDQGHEWRAWVYNRTGNSRTDCPECSMSGISKMEQELASFVRGLGVKIETNNRTLLSGAEVDIYCPDQEVAIEFNGTYWHSEKFRGKDAHALKTDKALLKGVQLIHLWSDDWEDKREVVEKMLKRKLGVSDEPRLNARSLRVGEVISHKSRKFLEENHIQGATNGSVRLALLDKSGEIKALTVFRSRSNGTWELSRFATSAMVRGGFTRLLKHFIRDYAPSQIVTFADRGVSDGGLYEKAGFVKDGELAPDYTYLVSGTRREHKFNYRKSRFKADDKLVFQEGVTEGQLAKLNNLPRVYDAGKVRWVWRAKME